jgi:hypothetical protein
MISLQTAQEKSKWISEFEKLGIAQNKNCTDDEILSNFSFNRAASPVTSPEPTKLLIRARAKADNPAIESEAEDDDNPVISQ